MKTELIDQNTLSLIDKINDLMGHAGSDDLVFRCQVIETIRQHTAQTSEIPVVNDDHLKLIMVDAMRDGDSTVDAPHAKAERILRRIRPYLRTTEPVLSGEGVEVPMGYADGVLDSVNYRVKDGGGFMINIREFCDVD